MWIGLSLWIWAEAKRLIYFVWIVTGAHDGSPCSKTDVVVPRGAAADIMFSDRRKTDLTGSG